MEIILLSITIITFICGIFTGFFIKDKVKETAPNECCIDDYDIMLRCKKLFVTTHYKTLNDYNIIDIGDYLKQGIIRISHNKARTAEAGEMHGRTYLYGPALVYKKKGSELWEWAEL